jgi:hypothetical protein
MKAAGILKQDLKNRHDTYAQQIDEITGRIRDADSKLGTQGGGNTSQGGASSGAALPDGGGKVIDKATALKFYEAAGKDPEKARQLAIQNHWKAE